MIAVLLAIVVAMAAWIGIRSLMARDQLQAAVPLASQARDQLVAGDGDGAATTLRRFAQHAESAAGLTSDPIFAAGTAVPVVGPNLKALGTVAGVVDDIATDGVAPLILLAGSLDLGAFAPVDGRIDYAPLIDAAPALQTASVVFDRARDDVVAIDTSGTIGEVTDAVQQLSSTVDEAASALHGAAVTARLLPPMLGSEGQRDYLLLFQNNAELRATGGIPGALAVVTAADGGLSLTAQAAANDFPRYPQPVLPVDATEQSLFGNDFARYMQNVNYTPEFPSAAQSAREMWARQYGQSLDGVIAVDPVFLGYLLEATGPITLASGDTLDADSAASFLLSTVYQKYPVPATQDLIFADAARQVFSTLTDSQLDIPALAKAFARGSSERRILIWNADEGEQALLAGSTFSGSLEPASDDQDTIGVFFNDATGAKMDVYLQASTSVAVDACTAGSTRWRTDVELSSTAPADAATSLPAYVRGNGASGVASGSIRTRVLVYGPVDAVVTAVQQDGVDVAAQVEQQFGRGVSQLVVDLAPGQSTVVSTEVTRDGAPAAVLQTRMTPILGYTQPKIRSLSCD